MVQQLFLYVEIFATHDDLMKLHFFRQITAQTFILQYPPFGDPFFFKQMLACLYLLNIFLLTTLLQF